jgi:hypothetical protein
MKHLLAKTFCAVLLTLIAATGFTQNMRTIKPVLFAKLPGTIKCTSAELNKFFAVAQGKSTSFSFDNTFKTNGIIVSNLVKYQNLQSLAIKLPEFNNAIFSLSKRIDDNKNIIYTGRIINQQNADAYQLKKIDGNNYQLVKINLEDILQDCAHQ